MSQNSFSKIRYFVSFIDDKSRYSIIYFLKTKQEVFTKFQEYKAYTKKQTRKLFKILKTDNRDEYCLTVFKKYYKKARIRRQITAPYTLQ